MENTLERIAKCRYKAKMDKHNGFSQVDLTAATKEHHVVHTSCTFFVLHLIDNGTKRRLCVVEGGDHHRSWFF